MEQSQVNNDLIKTVLRLPEASKWTGRNHNPFVMQELHSECEEYRSVEARFRLTESYYTVTKIGRIENPYLLAQYLLVKEEKASKERFYDTVQEVLLFHGTNLSKVEKIARNNFNWRLKGQARGHKFGQGVSFAPDSRYAKHYTITRTMILARVLVVSKAIGSISTIIPPGDSDTTTNAPETVFVKYCDNEFYPEYLITFASA